MLDLTQLKRLKQALSPKTVAVIGATKEEGRVGYSILESIVLGGFEGKILPVHPRHEEIMGLKVYPDLGAIGEPVDLVIIALNERKTIAMLHECGKYDVKGAICVAGGFSEIGEEGKKLQEKMTAAAVQNNIMLIGPNTLGVLNAQCKLNATFWPIPLDEVSGISLITQSGGVGQMVGFKMQDEGLPINKMIGLGNRAVLDFDDLLQYLDDDDSTKVIGVFLEGTDKARSFVQIAKETVTRKPVVVMKAGRSSLAQQFSVTHTGSMAGSYKMYQDIFAQSNLLTAASVAELVSICNALSIAPMPQGNGVSVVTPTAGPSLILVDLLDSLGCTFNQFTKETILRMEDLFVGVPVVLKNPLDAAAAGYSPETYVKLVDIVLSDPGVNLLIPIWIEHKNRPFPALELTELVCKHQKPMLIYYMGNQKARQHQKICQDNGVPFFLSPEEAAWAAGGMIKYWQIRNGSK
jgi:acetate---CoA ligase (ADP-forming) subunit alpha